MPATPEPGGDLFLWRRDPAPGLAGIAFTSAALDLGDRQDPAQRADAFGAVTARLGVAVAVARQVHGRHVLVVDAGPTIPGRTAPPVPGLLDLTGTEADALVTTVPRVAVAVRVADCLPILIADRAGRVVAAVHAGRAGLLAGVIGAAVEEVARRAAGPLDAWIGPHICARCYEVPPDMAEDAGRRLGTGVPITRWGSSGIDLTSAAQRQLDARGVRVSLVGGCTLEDDRLHSHRRDAAAGRMAGLAWLGG